MEIASYLIDKASSITVIGSSELPYQNTLGREIGRATMLVRNGDGERAECSFISVQSGYLNFASPSDAVREKCEVLHER